MQDCNINILVLFSGASVHYTRKILKISGNFSKKVQYPGIYAQVIIYSNSYDLTKTLKFI